MGFLRLLRPWGFSHEARLGPQGASRAAPGKSGLHAHGEGELVITLESWEARPLSLLPPSHLSLTLALRKPCQLHT